MVFCTTLQLQLNFPFFGYIANVIQKLGNSIQAENPVDANPELFQWLQMQFVLDKRKVHFANFYKFSI